MILPCVMEWEGEDVLGRGRDEQKKVHMAEGSIERQVSQGRNTRETFASAWLAASGKRALRLLERVPLLYLEGHEPAGHRGGVDGIRGRGRQPVAA